MSHSHEDRVADRPTYLCAAYGCPMIGTMSTGTKGGDFMCHVHFGKEPGQMDAVTVEINRNDWLAQTIRDLRCRAYNSKWPETYQRIKHDLEQAGRTADYKHGPHILMVLLEAELLAAVKAALPPPLSQTALDMAEAA